MTYVERLIARCGHDPASWSATTIRMEFTEQEARAFVEGIGANVSVQATRVMVYGELIAKATETEAVLAEFWREYG
jgi:hypothetical protein